MEYIKNYIDTIIGKVPVVYTSLNHVDIPDFIKNDMKATAEMREVRFSLYDRFVLVPAEVVIGKDYLIYAVLVMLILSGLNRNGYSLNLILDKGLLSAANILLAFLVGAVAGPLLLPWLPGRSFSMKGLFSGIIGFTVSYYYGLTGSKSFEIFAWFLLFISTSSFFTMNFTGASTYTSLSGVKKEMKYAVPLQSAGILTGLGMWMASRFN
ncbi:hypothetical protein HZA55_07080 [Candidatus Poribacteria bacterium]|nr:hypothetical protein [Candidatus Poribacteria bacterium]